MKQSMSLHKSQVRSHGLRRKELQLAWLLVFPALLYLFVILAFPLLWNFSLSFTDKIIGANPKYVGFQNYLALLSNKDFYKSLINTFVFTTGR